MSDLRHVRLCEKIAKQDAEIERMQDVDTALRKRVEELEGVVEKARHVVRALEEEWVEEEWHQEDIELRDALAKLGGE